jgi:fructose-bisphosphate aldolase class I
LYDETLRQKTADGTPFAELLAREGIVPGIKVDKGAKPLAGFPGEKITEGLDGLRDRLKAYAALGARFTKWRAVLTLGPVIPTPGCIAANVEALARFAALSQEAGLVPIVEPETLMDGDHALQRHYEVTERVLHALFPALFRHRVQPEAMLLKVNMVLSGTTCTQQAGVADVAAATWRCMRRTVPAAVAGIVFLSGGQGDVDATAHLDALNRLGPAPWQLSFSYGRALQAPALKTWAGRAEHIPAAQAALLHRARCNSAARSGQYTAENERRVA